MAQEEEVVHGGRQLHLGELPQVQEDTPRGHRGRDGRGRGGLATTEQNLNPLYPEVHPLYYIESIENETMTLMLCLKWLYKFSSQSKQI